MALLEWALTLILLSQSSSIIDGQCIRHEMTVCDSNFENCWTYVTVECP